MERKGALGYVWCVLRVWLSQVLILQSLRTHKLTLRVLNYAPPVTGQQICGQLRFNICGKNALRSKFTKQYEFAENSHKIVPLQGLQQYVRKEREPMDLFSPVTDLRGVGPARAAALQRLGIYTLYDLLAYFPRDYEDRTNPVEIAQLQPGVPACFEALVVSQPVLRRIGKGRDVTKLTVADETGKLTLHYFNQPYIKTQLHYGERYYFYGALLERGMQMANPALRRRAGPAPLRTGCCLCTR